MLTPDQFVEKWRSTELNERQTYQLHFLDVCALIGHEPPNATGRAASGEPYLFERAAKKESGAQGFADVFYEGHFAIEYKAPGKNLTEAYQQLQQYREKLKNPPLLVVTDINTWQIHTNWPNTEKKIYEIRHSELAARPSQVDLLRALFFAPERLHPNRNTEQVTAEAAKGFQLIADNMRDWAADPDRIAHFLTKLVFCLFAEDVSLLPAGPRGTIGIFSEIVERTRTESDRFVYYLGELFQAMADGGDVLFTRIPYFNGALFDDVRVEMLSLEALTALSRASRLNWESVEPAIFGTLFERSLDPGKRAQLGAHYTSREDILLIVEPVLMNPLRREWAMIRAQAAQIRPKYDEALKTASRRAITDYENQLAALRERMLAQIREIRVLDPACGSGNFLYVALQLLMDMEKAVIKDDLFTGLTEPFPEVHPRQMYGIEINPIAHALASIVVWIGYLQWRRNNGYWQTFKEPILEQMHDNIRLMDAILDTSGEAAREPDWPAVDVIIGNPPFLGGNRLRSELGDTYVNRLFQHYDGRIPAFADLVCYWFERARAQIESGRARRAGLLATNSIRGGANRRVLERIKETGHIFLAWSDREWTLEGAAVRVSIVGFEKKPDTSQIIQAEGISVPTQDEIPSVDFEKEPDNSQTIQPPGLIVPVQFGIPTIILNGVPVSSINADLTAQSDTTTARSLPENKQLCFRTDEKGGPFDIDSVTASKMLSAPPNPNGRLNSDVVRPYLNGRDVVQNRRNMWVIDFGVDVTEEAAAGYVLPYEYVSKVVKPIREQVNNPRERRFWWLHRRPAPDMREAVARLTRFIVTPAVASHRLFVWLDSQTIPDHQLYAIARDDDYFFGVLHSRLHEVWSLRLGTSLEDRPRYTPTTTFETFPFPWPPGKEDTASPQHAAISAAARQLHEERAAWLNVGGRDRTLTHLYNALSVMRGREVMRTVLAAGDFAPRLMQLHDALDRAVCAAYGWPEDILADEEAILRHLLALNLERAAADPGAVPVAALADQDNGGELDEADEAIETDDPA